MQPPRTAPAAPLPARQASSGRALNSMAAAIGRGRSGSGARHFTVLDQADDAPGRGRARREAAFLLRLRRGLAPYLRDPASPGAAGERIDGVLADGLLEAVDAATATVADLEGEPAARLGRFLTFCHELLAELVALGAQDVAAERRAVTAVKTRLEASGGPAPGPQTEQQLAALFVTLCARLEEHSPLMRPTLLDEALRGPTSEAAVPAAR